jgi:hypothetical protein
MGSVVVQQTRPQVLRLYKDILKLGRTWTAVSGKNHDTNVERKYIKSEAQTLFRKNKALNDTKVINDCIQEGQARIELGMKS